MSSLVSSFEVLGPWSLSTSKRFWEGFAPTALPSTDDPVVRTTFICESDWLPVNAEVTQDGPTATITVSGNGDLESAAAQVSRFLSLDVDALAWPEVALRDPVIAQAQDHLPGLRPCGFHSPYEAAAWSVLSQRIRIVQAASLRNKLIDAYGQDGAFPAPAVLRSLDIELPGRKLEYLHAVADAALDGQLDCLALRALPDQFALAQVQEIKGLGPFAADLVVIRGANFTDLLPRNEARLDDEVAVLYGPEHTLETVAENWRPFRSWASVYLRVLREERTHEIGGPIS